MENYTGARGLNQQRWNPQIVTIAAPTLRLSGDKRGQGNRVRLSDPRSLKGGL